MAPPKGSQRKTKGNEKKKEEIVSESEYEEEEDEMEKKIEKVVTKVMNGFKREMKNELREFEKSINFNHDKLDEINEKMDKMQEMITKMNENQEKLEIENKELKKKIDGLEHIVDDLEQYTRNRNVQIDGIPLKKDEDLRDLMMEIGKKIEVDIKNEYIDAIHRVPTRSSKNPEPIVVQFTTRQTRDAVVQKAREKKLCTDDFNMQCEKKYIYVNDHLTQRKKNLMFEARKLKYLNNYKFLWTKNGKIFIKKDETRESKTILLNTLGDLSQIV